MRKGRRALFHHLTDVHLAELDPHAQLPENSFAKTLSMRRLCSRFNVKSSMISCSIKPSGLKSSSNPFRRIGFFFALPVEFFRTRSSASLHFDSTELCLAACAAPLPLSSRMIGWGSNIRPRHRRLQFVGCIVREDCSGLHQSASAAAGS